MNTPHALALLRHFDSQVEPKFTDLPENHQASNVKKN